ncbi:ATP-binding protein [Hydrogenobaculum acidophilum]
MKILPIGIQSFWSIRTEKDYYYVDKTKYVKILSDNGKYYFLSRPRRFGKSLFLDTLRQAFLGKKELFKGLYLYDNWDWDKKYPVVYISFGMGAHRSPEQLKQNIFFQLSLNQENLSVDCKNTNSYSNCFAELILKAYTKYNSPVVVLIDEYDKPILDAIYNLDNAYENREILKDFYSPLKDLDPYLKLVFLAGVSRFSKVSIFSGLNQLRDITLSVEFATICGYTQSELENVFEDRLKEFDKEEVKTWYNGYNWKGESVYNPFDVMLLFAEKEFKPHWFETGTPNFLVKLLKDGDFYLPDLENLEVGEEILSSIDLDNMPIESLLFQTGYLTIKNVERLGSKYSYTLSYPNLEVRIAFNDVFLDYVSKPNIKQKSETNIYKALLRANFDSFKETLQSFLASIPYNWYTKNELDKYEGFYASLVYALFNGAGIKAVPEDTTNKGRIDLTAFIENKVYVIEFKVVNNPSDDPLRQIKEKKYYEKYLSEGKEIYIVGIEFSEDNKNIVGFSWERIR